MLVASIVLAVPLVVAGGAGVPGSTGSSGAAAASPTTIPFDLVGNHTFIQVTLKGKSLSFVFDTGAGGVALSEVKARHLGIEPTGSAQIVGAGGTGRTPVARGLNLRVGDLRLEGVTAALLPLDHLEALADHALDGIIGRDLMRGRMVVLDYDRNVIELHGRDDFPLHDWGQPCKISRGLPRVDGRIRLLDGTTLSGSFYVDSGAGMFLNLSAPFVRRHGLSGRVGATYGLTGRALTGVPIDDTVGRVAAVSFCGHEFPPTGAQASGLPAGLSGATAGVQSQADAAGLIGNGVLRRYNAAFDIAGDRLYLKPNRHFDDPILDDCSGLRLGRRGDGAVLIQEVVAGSPAEAAGLAAGDRLLSFDGAEAAGMPLEALRRALREPGRSFRIEALREGVPLGVVLESRSLFGPGG